MNIWGYEKKIKKANKEFKLGKNKLGERRYNILEKRIICWRHCIEKLRRRKK